MHHCTRFAASFLEELPTSPARADSVAKFKEPLPTEPSSFSTLLDRLSDDVLTRGLNTASGRYMAYVPGGGIPSAVVAEFLGALTNRYSGNHGACPAAAEIENVCVQWLIDLIGMPPGAWGGLTSGGTLAALNALAAARECRPPSEWGRGVIYHTSEWHHSNLKALRTLGLGHVHRQEIAVDSEFRMIPSELLRQIHADRSSGRVPWIVCATAGTTNTGAIDPLSELADISETSKMWLHVDGAYGGFFALSESVGERLRALKRADSIVLDPHKSLFLPYGCGAVVVRDGERLRKAFAHQPAYLEDLQEAGRSPSDYSLEGSRPFRGLSVWFTLKLHGIDRFRSALEEKHQLACYVHAQLSAVAGLEMGPAPQVSVVSFRVSGEDSERRTKQLLTQLQKRALAMGSSTRLYGQLFIRFCIVNFRTHLAEVDTAIQEIKHLMKNGG